MEERTPLLTQSDRSVVLQPDGCCDILKAEFKLRKFGLGFHKDEVFFCSQWHWPGVLFVVYRVLVALYSVAVLAWTISVFNEESKLKYPWPAWLTNWTYLALTCHLVLAAVICIVYTCQYNSFFVRTPSVVAETQARYTRGYDGFSLEDRAGRVVPSVSRSDIPWYMKVNWVLFNIVSIGAPMVTVVYFVALYPQIYKGGGQIGPEDLNLHLMNSVLVLLEIIFAAYPVRIVHAFHVVIFGILYGIFSLIYWAVDHSNVLYPEVLDWNHPLQTSLILLLLVFIAVPGLQILMFGIYRLKLAIYHRMYLT